MERVECAVSLFHRKAFSGVKNFDDVDEVRFDGRVLDQSVLRNEQRAHSIATGSPAGSSILKNNSTISTTPFLHGRPIFKFPLCKFHSARCFSARPQ